MKNNEGEVVGMQIGMSKEKQKPWTKIHVVGTFDDFMDNTSGKCVKEIYITGMVDVKLGDEVEVKYSPGYEGKAQVTGIVVL